MLRAYAYFRCVFSKHSVDDCAAPESVPPAERHLLHLLPQATRAGAVYRRTMDFPAQLEPVQASSGQIRWSNGVCQPRAIERQLLYARDGSRRFQTRLSSWTAQSTPRHDAGYRYAPKVKEF